MQLESLEENPGWVPGNFAGSPKSSLGLPTKDVLFGMRAVLGSILGGRGLSAGDEQVPIRCLDRAVVTQGTPLSYIPAPGARRNPRGAKPQTPSHSSRGRHALPRGFIHAHVRSASQPYSVFFFPSSAVFPAQPERVAVVTGGTDGIGYATAKCLAKLGMHVIIAGNNDGKALEVVRKIKEETLNEKVEFLYCDLASMRSVRQFVQKFKMKNIPLHVLVNNAGVMMVPERSTEDGFEEHFGVNYLGHFLLTNLLLDTLKASGSPGRSARVVTVSSATHYVGELNLDDLQSRSGYSAHGAYAQSKLALVLFTYHLQALLAAAGSHVTANVADPGVVNTNLYRHVFWGTGLMKKIFGWWFSKTPEEGSWTSVYAAVSPALEGVGGRYLYNEKETKSLATTYDRKLQRQLWARSCQMTGSADVTQDASSG